MSDSIVYGNSKPRDSSPFGSAPLGASHGLTVAQASNLAQPQPAQGSVRDERRPWIRKQVIKRMEGPNPGSDRSLSDAVLAKTANGYWVAWREQDANRIGLLPQGTPRTRGCIWLHDPGRRSLEQWHEYIESGRYERDMLREEVMNEPPQARVVQPAERPARSAELALRRFILPLAEAALAAGISISTLERLVRLGQFPKPRLLSDRRVGWLTREIEAWAESRPYSNLLPPPNTGASKSRRKSSLRSD